ncbi:MAG: carbohydrate kinase family protein [Alphaproteobacteria bacterium]|nr:carbohydrate kinase family protein [Alphaproteobacteria bacterium]
MRVLCSGNVAIDYYGSCPADALAAYLKQSDRVRDAFESGELFLGGKGMNFARAFAQAGADCWIHSVVGRDALGNLALDMISKTPVNGEFVVSRYRPTLFFSIDVSRASSPLQIPRRHAALAFPHKNIREEFLKNCACLVSHAHLGWRDLLSLCDKAKNAGTLIVFNPAPIENLKDLSPIYAADIVIANREEAQNILRRIDSGISASSFDLAPALSAHLGKMCVVTLDKDGATASYRGVNWHGGPCSGKAVDPVGAGDAFLGFFVSGLLRGYSVPDSLRIGQAAAGIVCSRFGAHPGGLSFDTVFDKIRETPAPRRYKSVVGGPQLYG